MASTIANNVMLQMQFDSRLNDEISYLKSEDGLNLTEHELQSHMNELEYEFSLVRERHDKIVLGKVQEASKKYLEDNVFTNLRMKYHKVWASIKDRFHKPSTSHEVFSSTIAPQNRSSTEIELPKLDLPIFSGKYEEWIAFRSMFMASVHNNPTMEPVVKLRFLKRVLTGDAALLIQNLTLNDQNYEVAMRLLTKRYEHKRRLVNSYFKKLYDFPVMQVESAETLNTLLIVLHGCTSGLNQLDLNIEDYQLIYHICRKLPSKIVAAWEKLQGTSTRLPEFKEFREFLETRFRTAEMVDESESSNKAFHITCEENSQLDKQGDTTEITYDSESSNKAFHIISEGNSQFNQSSNANSNIKSKTKSDLSNQHCVMCKGNHRLNKCEKFTKLNQPSRVEFIKKNKSCFNCLSPGHGSNSCWSNNRCRVCGKLHHSLLHKYATNSISNQNSNSNLPTSSSFHINSKQNIGTLLGTAQIRAISPVGISIVIRALIDPCSEDNYILASTVQTLNLKKYYAPTVIGVLGEDNSTECSHRVDLTFKSICDQFSMKITAGIVERITSNLPSVHLPSEVFQDFSSLSLADNGFNKPGMVQVLLGVNVHTKIMLCQYKRLGEHLIAENSLLGYIIRGQVPVQGEKSSLVLMTTSVATQLNSQIKKFWETEEINCDPPKHPDDILCEKIFKCSIHQNTDGFLSMDLPFQHGEDPIIGHSRFMAVRRFLSLEKKLNSNCKLRNEYHNTIKNYLLSNHLEKVPISPDSGYYLPHHAVIKETSSTTKVRVVFDASCRSLDGTSLNDHLLTGAKLQRDIRDILFNWRQYPYAVTGDIEKMYRMFFKNSRHHAFQKIVWRFNENDPIQDFVLKTATFGTSCAPFLAIRSLLHIAELHQTSHPSASKSITEEFYVDDFLSGGFSVSEALTKQTEVREILKKFNLSLRKWSSNDEKTLSNIPPDLLELKKEIVFDESEFRKTLGIFWCQNTDSFFFSISHTENFDNLTKRKILSLIARLYDPLGWVSPCTMFAKQIMQRVWQHKIDWDDQIDEGTSVLFKDFLEQLPLLKNFSIPRWTNIQDSCSPITLLGFSDASDKGHSAVVYLLNPKSEGPPLLLLTSKTKVADLKFQSTARSELNGALLLSNLLKWAVGLYKPRKITIKAFCDSKIVLAWLQGQPAKWKTYIANRVAQILDWMEPSQWYYVSTSLNPADCASRGLLPKDLIEQPLWLNGPDLNLLDFDQNISLDDNQRKIVEENVKKNSVILHCTRLQSNPLLTHFSNHSKLLKRMSTIITFPRKITEKIVKTNPSNERFNQIFQNMVDPENVLFRMLQKECFFEEIKNLRDNKELKSSSKLRSLTPFLDANGILRVGGRLQNADLTFDQRHPIILPKHHQMVKNFISLAHDKTMHGSELLTLAYLRNKFYFPRMSEKVRYFIHNCMKCYKFSKRQQEILMGSLPKDRVNFSHPFAHTGVDYAGPLTTKAYGGRCKKFLKSYIAVFICLCTKAIHIELVSDLTSQSFLAAFKRFTGRRGRCHRLYSDNGKNFVGANKVLSNNIKLAENSWKTELDFDFNELGTEWHFIPPSSPNFGGLWEAGVKSIKTHLKKTVGSSLLTFEEINTLLIQIEAVLNSRPLCRMYNNPNEYNFLTPAHFLIGRSIITPPEKCYEIDKKGPLQRWHHVQSTFQRFARLWKRDYLQNLLNRPKGFTTTVNYEPGNLVLLTEDETPPTLWPTAIIEKIHPGTDGIVRVATIRIPSGKTFKRPISKLRFLPCNVPSEI